MPKSIWEFWKPKKGRKVEIFGRIWSNFRVKKVLLCCNTVLHLGILRLGINISSKTNICSKIKAMLRCCC